MSSQFHESFAKAKAGYQSLSYDGDLGAELLPTRRRNWGWVMPLAGLAAAVALVLWPRALPHPPVGGPAPTASIARASGPRLAIGLPQIDYAAHVDAVDTSVRACVHALRGNVDRALTAPLVTQGVERVDQVTDGLKDIASNTWSQMRAGKTNSKL